MPRKKKLPSNIEERSNAYRVHIVTTVNGVKHVYSKTFPFENYDTKEEALADAVAARDEQKKQKTSRRHTFTVSEIYEKSCELIAVSVKTKERHRAIYSDAIERGYGDKPISDITTADIIESLNRIAVYSSDDRIKRALSLWKRVFKTALLLNLNIPDRTAFIVPPKSKKAKAPQRLPITDECIDRMVEAVTDYNTSHASEASAYDRATIAFIIQVMRYTGMRPAEVIALKVEDIDMKGRRIAINKAIGSDYEKKQVAIPPKTDLSRRIIPISEQLCPHMLEALQRSRHPLVFARFDGTPWDIDDLSDKVNKIAKRAGLQFRLYDLRHAFATKLLNNGTPPAVVRDLMGHSNTTTSIYYSQSSEQQKEQALSII